MEPEVGSIMLRLPSIVGAHRARRKLARALFILLLLTSFTGVQTASAITEQIHHHDGPSHTDCCGVCHASHLSFTQAADNLELVLPDVQCWHATQDAPAVPGEFVASLHLSRAPPCLHS